MKKKFRKSKKLEEKIHFVQIQKKPKNYTTFGTHTFVDVFDAFKGQIKPQFGITDVEN